MSGSITGNTVRSDVAYQDQTVPYTDQAMSDGTQGSLTGTVTPNTNLVIDVPTGTTPASDLFLGSGYSFIQNYNDTAPVIATGTDANTAELVYEGDTAGQTFYAGTGTEYAAFAGYGNLFVAPSTGGGTYEVSAGLVGNPSLAYNGFDATDLAPAPSVGGAASGNTVVAASGNASIAAGLGNNSIFLGTGTAYVASEGHDGIVAGSGDVTVDGAGAATVFAGTGAVNFYGSGGTGEIYGSSDSAAGALNVIGGNGAVTVYGGAGSVSASGGLAGNNVLVGGTGNSTLFGGGSGDQLVAGGASTNALVAGAGNETLFGGSATGTTDYFLGTGADLVVAGQGSDFIQFGAGSSTVFAGSGSDVFGLVNGTGGSSDLVVGFNSASDYLNLQGFGTSSGASPLSDVTVSGGSSFIHVAGDTTTIELYGVTNLTSANFV